MCPKLYLQEVQKEKKSSQFSYDSFRRKRVKVITTSLRYRMSSYGKQEIVGIFQWEMHRGALSSVLSMEKGISHGVQCSASSHRSSAVKKLNTCRHETSYQAIKVMIPPLST